MWWSWRCSAYCDGVTSDGLQCIICGTTDTGTNEDAANHVHEIMRDIDGLDDHTPQWAPYLFSTP